jgi:hypothetical protein
MKESATSRQLPTFHFRFAISYSAANYPEKKYSRTFSFVSAKTRSGRRIARQLRSSIPPIGHRRTGGGLFEMAFEIPASK